MDGGKSARRTRQKKEKERCERFYMVEVKFMSLKEMSAERRFHREGPENNKMARLKRKSGGRRHDCRHYRQIETW